MVKMIYLVRHGESEDNVADNNTIKADAAELTEEGRAQARFVAERSAGIDIDVVLASTLSRARETADIIHARIKKPIEYHDLFVERRPSSKYAGMSKEDATKAYIEFDANLHKPGFRNLDEENTEDLQTRAVSALSFLITRPEENILVVSHSMFLRAFAAAVLFGNDVTIRDTAQCMRVLRLSNTGLSIVQYNPDDPISVLRLIVWNDHAHLG